MSQRDEILREVHFGHAHLTEISASGNSLRTEIRELWAYRDLSIRCDKSDGVFAPRTGLSVRMLLSGIMDIDVAFMSGRKFGLTRS